MARAPSISAASIATEMRLSLDPVAFATERLSITPDPWQQRVLRSDAKRTILVCSRQSGKSTTTAILAAHTAIYQPGSLILMIAPTQRQAAELFAKSRFFIGQCQNAPKFDSDSVLQARMANGSRIVALPGDNANSIRGYSAPKLVICDEAAFCADELFTAMGPMMAVSPGKLMLLSTPNGRQGHFFHVYQDGGDAWHRERITADQCPRISREFLEEEERLNGPYYMRTEYKCEFLESTNQYFSDEAIQAILSADVPRLALSF